MQNYLRYLEQVLGIKQFLRTSNSSVSTAPAVLASTLVVWVEHLSSLNNDEKLLLDNMLAAMKINRADMVILDLSEKSRLSSQISEQAIQFELVLKPVQNDQTYAPQVLVQDKALKAKTWTFLQSIMAQYNARK